MFSAWIWITLAAAFFQNLRSVVQKNLNKNLSGAGAAYARFLYALPIALIYVFILLKSGNLSLPTPNIKFFVYCLIGGVFQILFTMCLLWIFTFKSFAVGTTFSKLEVIMVAIGGMVILGEHLSLIAILAMLVSSLGAVALSLGQRKMSLFELKQSIVGKSMLVGCVCAALLGACSVFISAATQALSDSPFYLRAGFTLVVILIIQCIIMGAMVIIREPGQFAKLLKNWKQAAPAGLFGAVASIFWFSAFTLEKVAYVRAVGQIELVFSFIATTLFFREKVSKVEVLGIILVSSGICVLLLLGVD